MAFGLGEGIVGGSDVAGPCDEPEEALAEAQRLHDTEVYCSGDADDVRDLRDSYCRAILVHYGDHAGVHSEWMVNPPVPEEDYA